MARLQARAFAFILRTTGFVRKNFTGGSALRQSIAKARQAPSQLPTAKQRMKLDIREEIFDGHPVWYIAPRQGDGRTLLYFHGGGYVYAASNFHWAFLCHLAEAHNISIIAPLYPLAPEHAAETTTRFALDLYRHVLASQSAETLVMGGDSAGGGLTAATLMAARDAGMPLPARALLICPWLNAEPDHPDQVLIEPRDAILTRSGIADAGRIYAGALPVTDPRVSPIHGDWSGMPPLYVLSGGDDILVADARALQARLPDHNYQEEAGMIHDWPIFTFPESRAAQKHMAAFINA